MKTTQSYMTKRPVTIKYSETLQAAYKLMRENSFRHLPVVDEKMSVIGILSDRDIQRAMTNKKISPLAQESGLSPDLIVEDYMNWPVYTVREETPLKQVAAQMLTQKVSAFLVESCSGKLRGIVTTDDILRAFLNEETKTGDSLISNFSHYFLDPEITSNQGSPR